MVKIEKEFVKNMFSIAGKVALVTGATGALGSAVAKAYGYQGAKVVLTARNEKKLAEIAAEFKAEGIACASVCGDPAVESDMKKAVDYAVSAYGELNILAVCHGFNAPKGILEQSVEDWQKIMDADLKSVYIICKAAAEQLVAQGKGGKIVNVASMLSFQGGIRVPSYTASKSGIAGITRLLANEWGAKGINVNAIAPGYMATNNTAALRADTVRNEAILDRIPAGRWGVPEDLAGPVVFLASGASDYVNGYTVAVDGGWLAR